MIFMFKTLSFLILRGDHDYLTKLTDFFEKNSLPTHINGAH